MLVVTASMDLREKIIPFDELISWGDSRRKEGKRIVATNGCFDLLHPGHVLYLQQARLEGDLLVVGINGDASVRELKGPTRPLNSEHDRAMVVAALESVGAVTIFPQVRATEFINRVKPHIYVKGGDYSLETLNPEERERVEQHGGKIVLIPFVPGKSTTALLRKAEGK